MALKTILLLTRQEEYPYLKEWLAAENPAVEIIWTPARAELDAVTGAMLADARLVSFVTNVVVPLHVLQRLGHGAYNFHPGPPGYPGSAPATFAIYDGATTFGVTFHEMEERVDAGPIVDFDQFPLAPDITLNGLEQTAYAALIRLFRNHANALMNRAAPLSRTGTPWGRRRSTRRDFAQLCDIPADVSAAELHRRIRALGLGDGKAVPTVTLHGYRFTLASDQHVDTA